MSVPSLSQLANRGAWSLVHHYAHLSSVKSHLHELEASWYSKCHLALTIVSLILSAIITSGLFTIAATSSSMGWDTIVLASLSAVEMALTGFRQFLKLEAKMTVHRDFSLKYLSFHTKLEARMARRAFRLNIPESFVESLTVDHAAIDEEAPLLSQRVKRNYEAKASRLGHSSIFNEYKEPLLDALRSEADEFRERKKAWDVYKPVTARSKIIEEEEEK